MRDSLNRQSELIDELYIQNDLISKLSCENNKRKEIILMMDEEILNLQATVKECIVGFSILYLSTLTIISAFFL